MYTYMNAHEKQKTPSRPPPVPSRKNTRRSMTQRTHRNTLGLARDDNIRFPAFHSPDDDHCAAFLF